MSKISKLKKEKSKINYTNKRYLYPTGGVVYAIDYSTEYESIYRIGMTGNMAKRKNIYNTHTLHNHKVVLIKQTKCPIQLVSCIKAMLYNNWYYFSGKVKKDFYKCTLNKLKSSFNQCFKSIECINKQKGGSKTNKKHIENNR